MSYDAACATLKSLGLNVSEKGVKGGGKTIVVTEQDICLLYTSCLAWRC